MKEWKVLRNGKLWNDRYNSEEDAVWYVEMEAEDDAEYEVMEMTEEDMKKYKGDNQ